MKFISKAIAVLSLLLALAINGTSQTNPQPYDLSSGNYHFTQWDSLAVAESYPEGMIFQYVPSNRIGAFYNDSTSDYTCPYNLTKRPRVIGYMNKGIALVTTSSSQYNDCSSGTADHRYMGAALLALNTVNRSNIRVQWKSETLIPGDGNGTPATPRIWNLRLQYRIGTNGNFSDVPGPVEFIAGIASGDSILFGPTILPSPCNNVPEVQLRWIYFESSAGSGGTRPRLRLDDISVTSESWVGMNELEESGLKLYPNPASDKFFIQCESMSEGTVSILDNIGKIVWQLPFANNSNGYDCSRLAPGIYFVKITETTSSVSRVAKLIIR